MREDLDPQLLSTETHLQKYTGQFWEPLVLVFLREGRMQCLADIICFVNEMWLTVPITKKNPRNCNHSDMYEKMGQLRWPKYNKKKKGSGCWQHMLLDAVKSSQEEERISKIKLWVIQMFGCLSKVYLRASNRSTSSETIRLCDFVLHCVFHLIIIYHSNNAASTLKSLVKHLFGLKNDLDFEDSDSDFDYDSIQNDSIFETIIIDFKKIETMTKSSIADFTLMRLLVLTVPFLVECQTSMDVESNISCIWNNQTISDELTNHSDELALRLKKIEPEIDRIYRCKRNKPNGKDYMLSKEEVLAIRILTDEECCSAVKSCHKSGNSCAFRIISSYVMSGLSKLKNFDTGFDIRQHKFLYSGLMNAEFDPNKFETFASRVKNDGCTNDCVKYYKQSEDYCLMYHTFMSTSVDFEVASEFCFPFDKEKSILFEIEASSLCEIIGLVYGDVSWISVFRREHEVLISPAMIDVYINPQKGSKLKVERGVVQRYGAQLKPIYGISNLWKRLRLEKQRLMDSMRTHTIVQERYSSVEEEAVKYAEKLAATIKERNNNKCLYLLQKLSKLPPNDANVHKLNHIFNLWIDDKFRTLLMIAIQSSQGNGTIVKGLLRHKVTYDLHSLHFFFSFFLSSINFNVDNFQSLAHLKV